MNDTFYPILVVGSGWLRCVGRVGWFRRRLSSAALPVLLQFQSLRALQLTKLQLQLTLPAGRQRFRHLPLPIGYQVEFFDLLRRSIDTP